MALPRSDVLNVLLSEGAESTNSLMETRSFLKPRVEAKLPFLKRECKRDIFPASAGWPGGELTDADEAN